MHTVSPFSYKRGLTLEEITVLLRELSDDQSDSGELSGMHDEENFIPVVSFILESDEDIEIGGFQDQNELVTHSIENVFLEA